MKSAILPQMSHTWTFEDLKGSETGTIHPSSTFTYERLTLGGRLKVNKMEAKLREELTTLDNDVNLYVEMIALLRYGLTEYPDWWKETNFGLEIYDINVITNLYLEVQKFENEWDKKVGGGEGKAKDIDDSVKAD